LTRETNAQLVERLLRKEAYGFQLASEAVENSVHARNHAVSQSPATTKRRAARR
jgi:hypothetical protein